MPNRPQPRLLQAVFVAGVGLWLASKPRRPARSLLWSALLLAADLAAIPGILRAKPRLSADELGILDPEEVPVPDRLALRLPVTNREAIRKSSDNMLRAMVAAPVLLLPGRRASDWLLAYVWGHALTYTIYTFSPLGPAFSDKYRPIVYRGEIPEPERARGNNRNSQYSGHTGNAAFAAFFLAGMLYRRTGGGRLQDIFMTAVAGGTALLLGSLRVRAQKHFPTDVILATVIGAVIAGNSLRQSEPFG